jgi:uncharacterized protein YebE (UPF0316 family)
MWWVTIGNALLIFCLRVTDVSMGTVRTIMVLRGMRKIAALIGFVEVSIWVIAISRVLGNLDSVVNVLAYGGGFATGTLLGMWIEDKLALGHVYVHVVSRLKGHEIAHEIRQAGYGATQVHAEGQSGPVHLIDIVAPRKRVNGLIQLVNQVDAESFVTIEEARKVMRGYYRAIK